MLLADRLETSLFSLADSVTVHLALLSISIPMDKPSLLLKLGQLEEKQGNL